MISHFEEPPEKQPMEALVSPAMRQVARLRGIRFVTALKAAAVTGASTWAYAAGCEHACASTATLWASVTSCFVLMFQAQAQEVDEEIAKARECLAEVCGEVDPRLVRHYLDGDELKLYDQLIEESTVTPAEDAGEEIPSA